MHDEIRIAPDRRREVGVARERKPEVTEVRRRIARLLHRAQDEHGHRALLGPAVNPLEQRLEVVGTDRVRRRAEGVPETRHELLELLHLERVGRLVDPVEPRNAARLEELRHRLVGEQHELLDDPVRDVPLGRDDGLDLSGLVEHHLGFVEIEVNRPQPSAPGVQHVEERAHPLEHRHQRGVPGRETGVAAQDGVHRRCRSSARTCE